MMSSRTIDLFDDLAAAPAATGTIVPRAVSVAFDGCLGTLHEADGAVGIVYCPPWGYEELVSRASWRELAEMTAVAGYPSLRFDFPGTGNSLGDPQMVTLEDWVEATRKACALLRRTGVTSLVLIGQSMGALVACLAGAAENDIAGLVLFAPAGGRRHLRESAAWAAMISGAGRFEADPKAEGFAIAGFSLPPAVFRSVKSLTLSRAPAPWALLVDSPQRPDKAFADALGALGVEIAHLPFDGVDRLLADPSTAQTPLATYRHVIDDLKWRAPYRPHGRRKPPAYLPAILVDAQFSEEALRFGERRDVFGVLCLPVDAMPRATVVFLNTGRNPHTGWRRMTVDHARRLAGLGIASLRFDAAGVGDTPRRADRPAQLLYSAALVDDAIAAVDCLAGRGLTSFVVAGVCSGANLALLAALCDPRIVGLTAINLPRPVWDDSESVDDAIRFTNRSADHGVRRLLQPHTLRLILQGKLDIRPAIRFRVRTLWRKIGAKTASVLGPLSPGWRIHKEARGRFALLQMRGVATFLGYTEADDGFNELTLQFGPNAKRLSAFPAVKLGHIPRADHNLTQQHACDCFFARIVETVGRLQRTE